MFGSHKVKGKGGEVQEGRERNGKEGYCILRSLDWFISFISVTL